LHRGVRWSIREYLDLGHRLDPAVGHLHDRLIGFGHRLRPRLVRAGQRVRGRLHPQLATRRSPRIGSPTGATTVPLSTVDSRRRPWVPATTGPARAQPRQPARGTAGAAPREPGTAADQPETEAGLGRPVPADRADPPPAGAAP